MRKSVIDWVDIVTGTCTGACTGGGGGGGSCTGGVMRRLDPPRSLYLLTFLPAKGDAVGASGIKAAVFAGPVIGALHLGQLE